MRLAIPARARKVYDFADGWTLYHLPENGSFLWQPFRLMLPPGTPARRGVYRRFTLAWNPVDCRFSRAAPTRDLMSQQPGLYAQVELYMSLNFGPEWLASGDGGGYTPDEIQAERERLAEARAERKAARRARA